MPGSCRALLALALAAFAFSLATLVPRHAYAYPWMIRHGYSACQTCHFDPSGAGILTSYGRVIETLVLPTGPDDQSEEDKAGFLFNAVKLPEWLALDGDARALWLRSKAPGAKLTDELILMQADAQAAIRAGRFVAAGSLGYASRGALGAALTRDPEHNLVSRQHWVGYSFASDRLLLRFGRMNLPFGIRTLEHNLWVRSRTRTSINDDQQYGLAAFYSTETVRAELMAIIGNYQLRPDDYRERGYSGYAEWLATPRLGLGVSSLITHRDRDTVTLTESFRHTHGAFARWATDWDPLVLQTEWDYVLVSSKDAFHRKGLVSFTQADLEPVKGLHLLATAELSKVGSKQRFWGYGGWLSFWWFFMPHADVRLDAIYQSQGAASGRFDVFTLLLQGHVSL